MKRGRDSQSKTKALVMCESTFQNTSEKAQKTKKAGYLKMKVIPNLKANTITQIVKEQVDRKSDLLFDDSISYVDLEQHVTLHSTKVIKPDELEKVISWVHTTNSNAKRLLLDLPHMRYMR